MLGYYIVDSITQPSRYAQRVTSPNQPTQLQFVNSADQASVFELNSITRMLGQGDRQLYVTSYTSPVIEDIGALKYPYLYVSNSNEVLLSDSTLGVQQNRLYSNVDPSSRFFIVEATKSDCGCGWFWLLVVVALLVGLFWLSC